MGEPGRCQKPEQLFILFKIHFTTGATSLQNLKKNKNDFKFQQLISCLFTSSSLKQIHSITPILHLNS